MHCVNLYSDICQVPNGGKNWLQQMHKTELLNFNMCNWTKVWYSLLHQFMKEKISDKFYHIGKWSAKVYRKQIWLFLLWLSVAPKMSFNAPTRKCEEQNLKCTALICINAPKVETIKHTFPYAWTWFAFETMSSKLTKLIMNQNAMLMCNKICNAYCIN